MIAKITNLLTLAQKKQAISLLILAMIGMFLEMAGVGLIVPILVLMTEPEPAVKYPVLQPIWAYLEYPSQIELVAGAMLGLAGFYILKVGLLIYIAWRKVCFVTGIRVYFSEELFYGYLHQPYTFHLQRNSAELIRNVTGDVKSYNKGVISILDLVADGLILCGISTLLLWAEPLGAISVTLFLGGSSILLHHFTRVRLARWGETNRFHNGKIFQHLQQGLGGAKEVKILGREQGFKAQFTAHNLGVAGIEIRQKMFSIFPRLWFELLVVIGLTGLVLSMLAQGRSPSELVPILGLFAAAAFRMMPSMVRIFTAMQNLRFNKHAIEKLHDEVQLLSVKETEPAQNVQSTGAHESIKLWQSIRIKNASYTYPNGKQTTLRKINMAIQRNTSVGFVGGSGAGKSTLIDMILGLLTSTDGEISLDEKRIGHYLRSWQDQIGYVPQHIFLTDDTIKKNIALGLTEERINDDSIRAAIKAAQLEQFVDSLADGMDTLVGEHGVRLSGGQRQRIGIARALYHDPPVLVLDEATSSLDLDTEQSVMQAVRALQGNKTILIVAHRMTTVANCDWLYKMENGRIVQEGTYHEVVEAGIKPTPIISASI